MLHPLNYIAINSVASATQFKQTPKTIYINLNYVIKIEKQYYEYFNEKEEYHVVKLTDGSTYCITTEELQKLLNHQIYNPLVVINEI